MNNAGGSKDRETADYAEPGIPRLGGNFLPSRNRNFNFNVTAGILAGGDLIDNRLHHLPRHRVYGRFARRQRQSGLGHYAYACPSLECYSLPAEPDLGNYGGKMGDIRIVAGILDDAGKGKIRSQFLQRKGKGCPLTARKHDFDGVGKFASD
jgi:hypothetical protein